MLILCLSYLITTVFGKHTMSFQLIILFLWQKLGKNETLFEPVIQVFQAQAIGPTSLRIKFVVVFHHFFQTFCFITSRGFYFIFLTFISILKPDVEIEIDFGHQNDKLIFEEKIREIALDKKTSQIGLNSEQTFFREIFFSHFSRAPRSIEETGFFAETNFLRHRTDQLTKILP